uniref:Immunoglobulin I-set domain-containing protein n=1 Tax=Parascaris univalens TaxID=6257 RepID=A0A915AD12_PARUN
MPTAVVGSGFHSDDDGDDDPSDSADSGGTDAEMRKRERSNLASTTTAPIVYHFTTMHFHSGELVPQQVSSLSDGARSCTSVATIVLLIAQMNVFVQCLIY